MAVLIDITQRRKQEEERLRLERRLLETQRLESLGLMAGGIAHDFNNLLVSILGNTELALMELTPEHSTFELIKQVEVASYRAADLTRQMLAYSGRGKFFTRPLNLNDTLIEITRLLKTNLSKLILLETQLAASLPLMEADNSQIHQLLMNIVINASEAIGQNPGKIKIVTGTVWADHELLSQALFGQEMPEGWYIYIEVSDTGHGMDEETRSKMFDPFFTTKFTGRGLGLSAVQGIVRGHKGALAIESELGKGTTFRVYFPISQEIVTYLPQEQSEASALTKNSTILMVDDDNLLRNATSRMLNHFGFKVLEAVDGKHGIEVFLEHLSEIDCVLLDLTMPNLGGEETLCEMRKIKDDIKIVLMSGYSEQEVAKRFSSISQIEFLQKPYTSKELREKLSKAMSAI
jgi:nitrogen-specific signal transduction histidine kinase/ActR/RegA family two-component response regulator